MKGLLIAYRFAPENTVGALRPTYWAEEMAKGSDLQLDVVTATKGEASGNYTRFYVANQSKSIWSVLIKDEGLTWRKDLLRFFKKQGLAQYDFVILTGGPFFHFSLGSWFKKQGLKVIFDYRDPFSYNPRFNERGLKKWIKKSVERRFLKSADLVLTVNDKCHEYIGDGMPLKREILPNGYDERIEIASGEEIRNDFFYGGKFYWTPNAFLDVLEAQSLRLVHAGLPAAFAHSYLNGGAYSFLGMLSQSEMYKSLAASEIGVVFTAGVPFESTTKIYDYLRLKKKILIVTLGQPHQGVLLRELADYPMCRWVGNNADEIATAILELKAMDVQECDVSNFSRKAGLEKLIELIKALP
jgi:hypothetical protein